MKKDREKKHRICAAFLCVCMLLSLPGISDIFPVVKAAEQAESFQEKNVITAFDPLPEDIKVQTVFMGTDKDELDLPEELTVCLLWKSSEQKAEESEQENIWETDDIEENPDTETRNEQPEDTGESVEKTDETDTEDEEVSTGESEPVEEQGESETGQENAPAEEQQESTPAQETHTVTMPEYLAENVIPVQTLENTQTENRQETVTIDGVTWQSEPKYDGSAEGTYTFTAVLPDGYALAEGVNLPEITVTVESGTDATIQVLLDRIAALPVAEEYLALEPDMEEDEDAYAEWEEKLYEYAEEALAIWEEYEALTEEQRVQITEKELAKLTAWVELTETFSDHAVMLAGSSEHHGESDWTALTASDTSLSGGKYYLSDENGDLTMGTITINGGDVTLCLNGHKLQHDGTDGSVIVVGSGTFTLCDCQDHWGYTSSFDEDTKAYSCGITGQGGCITGGNGNNFQGGGVYVGSNATFNMNSGRITGCDVGTGDKYFGGGVYVSGGTFNMSGGFIDENKSGGGAVYIDNAEFTMSGNATVIKNECDVCGGVYVDLDSTFNMTSGNILGNIGGNTVGGVLVGDAATFTMSGGMIEGNIIEYDMTAAGGGVYCYDGRLVLSGGSIQHNIGNGTAAGGIRMLRGLIEMSDNIRIFNNYNGNGANNVSLNTNCTITVTKELSNDIGVTFQPPRGTGSYPHLVVTGTNSHSISDADWSHFSSDNKTYEIQKKETTDTGNELYLAEPGKCNLFDLTTDGATLSPSFDPNTTEYTSTVANSVNQVGITATLADASNATIKIKINDGAEVGMTSGTEETVGLNVGKNAIVITVTSDGMSKTYTIEITREEAKGNLVTITAYKDGVEWDDTPLPTYKLKLTSDNNAPFIENLAAVPDGKYDIYDGDINTNVTVDVNGAAATAEVYYHTVTFYDGSTALTTPAQQIVLKNQTASAPATDPTKTGYTFDKWVTAKGGSTAYDFTKAVTGKTSVYASWTPISYSITYVLDGGNVSGNPTSYTIESSAITLNNPTREGYTFTGWSGTDLTDNNHMSVTIASGSTGHRTYTANWKLADYTVNLHTNGGTGGTDLTSYQFGTGAVLPTDWTKTGYVFDGWYDNESCTGTAVTSISASDTGNKEYWAKWTDNIDPVIGTLQYSYEPKNFWNWLIGKDSLVITVPVMEEGSGADEITYTVTPDGGTAKVETATILNGEAKITVSADFKGTISIACTDKANNTSASVTVGAGVAPNGIIIEDNAPQIAFKAENAELLPSGEYKTVPNIVVTVADDKDNAISGGIASVSYQINGGSVKAVPHDYTASMVVSDSFTIQADEITASRIPADGVVISVTATDNAGNSITDTYTVKVHTHSGTLVPAIEPTCTTAGNKQHYTCTCGKLFSDSGCTNEITDQSTVVLDALGHYFEGEPYIVSTTQHWRKCSRCSVTEQKADHSFGADDKCTVCGYSRVVDPGHTHSGILIAATDPTCTLPGNRAYYICSSCGKLFSDSGCTVEITEQETKIEALKHNFSVTEHDQSEHWRKCSRCKEEQSRAPHVYDDDTDADCNVCGYVRTIQGHTHSGTLVAAETPTCTQDGNKAYYTCSCGKWFSDSACTNEITDHASVIVGKLGHDFSGQYLFNANGHWKVCSRCNEEQIPESHVFDDDNDTTCNKCDYRRTIGTHTHSMEGAVAATDPTCTVAGNKAYYICSCGKWFSDSACTKEVTAQDVNISAKGHKAVTDPARAATCTETGLSEGSHCSVCGHVIKAQTVTAALGHDYGNYHYDADGHWKVCRRCGAVSAKQGHNYDNDRDTKCNDCGWVRVISDSNHEQDEQPTPTPTPEPSAPPQPIDTPTSQPPSPTNPPEQPQPTDTPEDKQEPESTGTPEPTEKPSETEKEQQPEGDGEQTVPAAVDNGKIVISGEPVATGNVEGMTDTKTVLKLGNGAVIVTVVCAGQEYTAGVTDTLAVANAVLAPEQIQLINNGETIEIRIDVKDISDQVPEQDKETIENGIREYQKEVPGLTLGMYVDISMFIKVGEGGWNAITATREPIEVIIGIPESLQEKGRAYYIIRAHEGVHTFMSDMDADPYTITVSTNMFSSYAIAYVQAEGTGHKCGLCHICPTFLGICCFVWLVIIILIMIVTIILLRKKKKEQETEEAGQ